MTSQPVSCAVVPPVPVPYREPLFAELARSDRVSLRVIYQSSSTGAWDQPREWFPRAHDYDAVHLDARHRPRKGRTPVAVPRGLGKALAALNPDVVVCSEFGLPTLRALAWCHRHGRALVILTEVTGEVEQALPTSKRLLHRWLAARADGFIAVSSRARDRLVRMGVAPGSIEVSLQSADLGPIRAAVTERRQAAAQSPLRLLAVGRLVPDKNYGGLIDAMAAAGLGPEEAELHIHGVGPLAGQLRERADSAGVSVTFQKHSPPAALARAYAAADVFVLVSTYEPFGVVVREAVAAGLPLICSERAGAVDDFAFEGRNALLVDPQIPTSIARALERVCRDSALRASLAAESRAVDAEHPFERDLAAFERAILRAAALAEPAASQPVGSAS
jgi:glycosyltransferase involved in cell wall biosynthesis